AGQDREEPKLALYRLWLGPSIEKLKCLTRAGGDGKWGTLHDAYFLAEGSDGKLKQLFAKLDEKYGKPTYGGGMAKLSPISDKPLPAEAIKVSAGLRRATTVKDN